MKVKAKVKAKAKAKAKVKSKKYKGIKKSDPGRTGQLPGDGHTPQPNPPRVCPDPTGALAL